MPSERNNHSSANEEGSISRRLNIKTKKTKRSRSLTKKQGKGMSKFKSTKGINEKQVKLSYRSSNSGTLSPIGKNRITKKFKNNRSNSKKSRKK